MRLSFARSPDGAHDAPPSARRAQVAMNRFSVAPAMRAAFEDRFASRESELESYDGFRGFLLLRRDGSDDDGVTHSTCVRVQSVAGGGLWLTGGLAACAGRWSVWRDQACFDAWRASEKKPASKGPPAGAGGGGGPPTGGGPPAMFLKPPVPTFYEGILVLESEKGV
jgi:heme-degrading monooxygenase HmoA